MKQVVEFPFSLEEKVVVAFCIGPDWTDLKLEEGIVTELTINNCTPGYTKAAKFLFPNGTHCWYVENSMCNNQVFTSSMDEVIVGLSAKGYKIKDIKRF